MHLSVHLSLGTSAGLGAGLSQPLASATDHPTAGSTCAFTTCTSKPRGLLPKYLEACRRKIPMCACARMNVHTKWDARADRPQLTQSAQSTGYRRALSAGRDSRKLTRLQRRPRRRRRAPRRPRCRARRQARHPRLRGARCLAADRVQTWRACARRRAARPRVRPASGNSFKLYIYVYAA